MHDTPRPSYTCTAASSLQRGFTLVELAIALMVIGLLIGGILKGQELVENARVTSLIRQEKGYETAQKIFQNTYGALPGDIKNPQTRIPDCTASPCNISGDNNKKLDNTAETMNYWLHMAKASMISGINMDAADWMEIAPETSTSGKFFMSYTSAGGTWHNVYALTTDMLGGAPNVLSPGQAAQIDRKIDDGLPNTGDVMGDSSDNSCTSNPANIYIETSNEKKCGLYFSLQL